MLIYAIISAIEKIKINPHLNHEKNNFVLRD